MMTRSIVGRFLILAVLLVSVGVIAQAALIISKQSGRAVAKADPAPPARLAAAAPLAADPAPAAPAPAAAPADPAPASPSPAPQAAEAAPIRVVYPGPLGDAPAPRKLADATPALQAAPPAAPQPVAAALPTPAPAPATAVVASAEADAQPAPAVPAAAPAAGKGAIDLNHASVDALDHLGGGHIGQAIVKHRPYGSVDDLVKKRIVRRSVYEQIKGQVAAN